MLTRPTRITYAKSIMPPTRRRILALARLAAVLPEISSRTRNVARGAHKSGHTLTLAIHVIALAIVLAHALERTARTVRLGRTRIFARHANVAGSAHILSGHMIARPVVGQFRTRFAAAHSICTRWTRLRAVLARPAASADALTRQRIAGRVVQTAARVFAVLAVVAGRTLGATVDA